LVSRPLGVGWCRCTVGDRGGRVRPGMRRARDQRTGVVHLQRRWRDGAGSLPTFGILPHRRFRPCRCGRTMGRILDHRGTVKGLHRLARKVSESVGERWRDGVGSLLTIGFRSLRCFARMCMEANVTNSRPLEMVMGLCAAAAHSLRGVLGSDSSTARAVCSRYVYAHTDAKLM
jgi:hypothetical protein